MANTSVVVVSPDELRALIAEAVASALSRAREFTSACASEYLTPKQAAALLGVSVRGLEDLRRSGRGPSFVRVGRSVRYPRAELERSHARRKSGLPDT